VGNWRNYFTFQGRLNRRPYWLMSLIMVGVALAVFVVIGMLGAVATFLWILAAPLFVGFIWAGMSIGARRLHDRNKSAWWLVLYQGVPSLLEVIASVAALGGRASDAPAFLRFISFCISMWVLVDLGLLRGVAGSNRFGEDPLQPQGIAEAFA